MSLNASSKADIVISAFEDLVSSSKPQKVMMPLFLIFIIDHHRLIAVSYLCILILHFRDIPDYVKEFTYLKLHVYSFDIIVLKASLRSRE